MKDETFRVVLTGGGSGGHIYPLLAVAEAIEGKAAAMNFALELTYVGPKDAYTPALASHGIKMKTIMGARLRRYLSIGNIVDIPKFVIGLAQALWKIYVIMPDVIFSKGGTGSFPVVFAGWFYRIPVAIHESDARPGLSNLLSSNFSKKVFITFDAAAKYFNPAITERTGVPVRKELFANPTTKELAKETLGFSSSNPLMLVLGGSQGAVPINNFIVENLSAITEVTQVLHQTGAANFADVQNLSQAALMEAPFKNRYQPIAYLDEKSTALALSAADVVVSRAGSAYLTEIAAFGIPAILVPHGTDASNGHQRANAYDFAEGGGAVVIESGNLLPGIFISQVKTILGNNDLREKMSAAVKLFYVPDAAQKIVQGIMELVR